MDQAVVEEIVEKAVDDTEVAMDIDESESDSLRIAETSNEDSHNEQEEDEAEKEQDMEQEVEQEKEKVEEAEPEPELTPAQIQRSLDLKNEFLELFDIAPKLRNILGEIKDFMSNPEVSKADRDEIQELVEKKMNEEKAAKKKAKLEEVAKATAPPKNELTTKNELAEAIKNVVGIDLSSLLANKNPDPTQAPMPVPMTMAPPPVFNCPPQQMIATYIQPQQFAPNMAPSMRPNSMIQPTMPVNYGKAGFSTPHPKEVPAIPDELKVFQKKPEEICPIPSMLKNLGVDQLAVAPLPNELLPPQMRKKDPVEFLGPPIRRTLWLAGARPLSSRKLREKENEQYTQETVDADKFKLPAGVAPISDELLHPKEANAKKRRNQEKAAEYRTNLARREGSNAMEASLHRDSPIAVKRYHARQLAKETGMTVEEALDEIEEQCREFRDRPISPPRKSSGGNGGPGRRMRHVDDGHVPVDHSRGIPGIDRPPVGYSSGGDDQGPSAKRRRGGVKEREKQERRRNRWAEQDYGGPRNGRRGGGVGGGGRNRYDDGGYGGRYDDHYPNEDYSQDTFGHDPYNQESYDSQSGGGGYEGYYETNATGKYGETSGGGGEAHDDSYDGYYGYNNSNSYDHSVYGKNEQSHQPATDYDARQKPSSHYYQKSSATKSDNYYQQNTGQDHPSTYHATYGNAGETAEKAPIDPRKRY